MTISSGSSVRGWMLAVAFGVIAPLGCASNKASTNNGGTTPATKKNDPPPTAAQDTTPKPADPPPAAPSAQDEALVRVKDKMFPPVDVGAWLCEPKSWNDKGQVLLHCTAPTGTTGLIASLKSDPAIAEAVEAPK